MNATKARYLGSKTDNLAKQIQWNRSANPMELLNKSNGIVGQNQWICFLKASVLFPETDSLTCRNRQTGDQNSRNMVPFLDGLRCHMRSAFMLRKLNRGHVLASPAGNSLEKPCSGSVIYCLGLLLRCHRRCHHSYGQRI